jgi:hypothetical protein
MLYRLTVPNQEFLIFERLWPSKFLAVAVDRQPNHGRPPNTNSISAPSPTSSAGHRTDTAHLQSLLTTMAPPLLSLEPRLSLTMTFLTSKRPWRLIVWDGPCLCPMQGKILCLLLDPNSPNALLAVYPTGSANPTSFAL